MNLNKTKWVKGVDMSLVGINPSDSYAKFLHLCPYSSEFIRDALSCSGVKDRIKIIDRAITRCQKV
jgi:hypothetical protein